MKQKKLQLGYSFIEIPIALFIIALVLLIYAAASNTLTLNRNTKHQEVASRIASSEMEDLRATPFGSLPSTGPFSHQLLSTLPNPQASITVTTINSRTKEITATVTWQEPGNSNVRTISYTTYITQNGL